MEIYGEVDGCIDSRFLDLGISRFTSGERAPGTYCIVFLVFE
jgi:hypothetical protein